MELDFPQAPFNASFLDSVACDLPKGTWNLQKCSRGETVHVRSLMWPGYNFYHTIGSRQFGAMYVGDGLKNTDIHFIV